MSISTQWARIWNALESRKLTQSEAEDISAEINRSFAGNIADDEAAQAVRDLCECRRTRKMIDGKNIELRFTGQCGANMLISFIRLSRWRSRPESEAAAEHESCICSRGWLMYTADDGTEYAVPCLCSHGMKHMSGIRESEHEALRQCAEKAMERRKAHLARRPYQGWAVERLRAELRRGNITHEQAWEVICAPDDDRDCAELERYAERIGYDTTSIKQAVLRDLKTIMRKALIGGTRR